MCVTSKQFYDLGPTGEGRPDPVEIKRYKAPKPSDEPREGPVLFVRQKAAGIKDTPAVQTAGKRKKEESVKGLITSRGSYSMKVFAETRAGL